MPGDNCPIFGCRVSRRSKYKGIAIFKVPALITEFGKISWLPRIEKLMLHFEKEIRQREYLFVNAIFRGSDTSS